MSCFASLRGFKRRLPADVQVSSAVGAMCTLRVLLSTSSWPVHAAGRDTPRGAVAAGGAHVLVAARIIMADSSCEN